MSQRVPEAGFAVRNLSCPITIMRFVLVYNGSLQGTGNKPKPEHVRDVRDQFHAQLAYLWQTSAALKRLKWTSRVALNPGNFLGSPDSPFGHYEMEPPQALQKGYVSLIEPVVKQGRTYIPLVRSSLDLVCSLEVLFLRQEDPGAVVLQGGDLDNRVKALFDALRIPDPEVAERYPQAQDPTYCLAESDTLIAGFDVSSERLLFPKTEHPNEVFLVIEVTIRALKVGSWNVCLL